jgi:pantothenate synthetase
MAQHYAAGLNAYPTKIDRDTEKLSLTGIKWGFAPSRVLVWVGLMRFPESLRRRKLIPSG